jgi:hypothetical protein
LGGEGSARTIRESVQRQEAQQGDKAAAEDKAMSMNHDGDDGKHSTVMFRNIFKFSKIKPVQKEDAVDWVTQPPSGVTQLD